MSLLTGLIDTDLAVKIPQITTAQTTFAGSHAGRFFHGPRTPATVPANGGVAAPDLTLHPHYQVETWLDFGVVLGATLNYSLEIHQYNTGKGRGWVLHVWVVEGGVLKCRTVNSGPETYRELGWRPLSALLP